LVLLHVVRRDLSPVRDRISEYANGTYSVVMTASFLTLGVGILALGASLTSVATGRGRSRSVAVALIVAGCGMVISGLYATDPAGAPTSSERIHSLASGVATMALIAAALGSWLLLRDRRRRRAIGWAGGLALTALLIGVVSPALHKSAFTGLSQRALWLTLMGWLLLTAWQLASERPAEAPLAGSPKAPEAPHRPPRH
jgi:hypothetical protein